MSLSPDKIELVMQFIKALRDWPRTKIDPNIKGPENTYYGSICKELSGSCFGSVSGPNLYEDAINCLKELNPIVANEVEIKIEELIRRADEVDKGNKTLDSVQDYAADIAKELEDIVEGRVTQPTSGDKSGDMIKPQGKTKQEILDTEYSLPLSMKKWSSILGFSENKMKEIREAGDKYHFDNVSPRKWRLPKNELPAEYLEKYRQNTSQKHNKPQ